MCRDIRDISRDFLPVGRVDFSVTTELYLIACNAGNCSMQANECICRISEVLDWDQGGRTSQADLDRIFAKELECGKTRVSAVIRSGTKGIAFCKALNRCATYPVLPPYTDSRRATCIWGELHTSLRALTKADFSAELVDETVLDIATNEDLEAKRRSAESKRVVSPTLSRWRIHIASIHIANST
jgi:hypothetical protein